MQNNNSKNKNKFDTSFVKPEDVILSEDKKQIAIIHTLETHDYCLYDAETSEQATPWINGVNGKVVFTDLDPNKRYAIRVKRAEKKDKHEFRFIHTQKMKDDNNKK